MRVLILNGNPNPSGFDESVLSLAEAFRGRGCDAEIETLRDRDIRLCVGCWACWWKTPGLCAHRDAMDEILPKLAESDLVVWASPLVMGAVSHLLKTAQDRFIPLIHPYIELYKGECHHRHRYAHNPDMALYVETGPDDGAEDIAIARSFFERFALNAKTKLRFVATAERPVEEACDEALVR